MFVLESGQAEIQSKKLITDKKLLRSQTGKTEGNRPENEATEEESESTKSEIRKHYDMVMFKECMYSTQKDSGITTEGRRPEKQMSWFTQVTGNNKNRGNV
jgi:hypothetical protein